VVVRLRVVKMDGGNIEVWSRRSGHRWRGLLRCGSAGLDVHADENRNRHSA
jgi:hypothetical protein